MTHKQECGCYYKHNDEIVYCPTHKAAPEMFALLNEWLDTPFFETKEEWREWVEDYRPRVEQALGKDVDGDDEIVRRFRSCIAQVGE